MLLAYAVVGGALLAGCSSSRPGHPAPAAARATLAPCPTPAADARTARTGRTLPDLTLPCLCGSERVPLRSLTGTPTALNLWASWCAPCRAELPDIQRFATAAHGRVRVVGVDSKDVSPDASRSYPADAGVRFPSLYDRTGQTSRRLGVPGLPSTVFLRADGTIAAVAPRVFDYATLRAQVAADLHVDVAG